MFVNLIIGLVLLILVIVFIVVALRSCKKCPASSVQVITAEEGPSVILPEMSPSGELTMSSVMPDEEGEQMSSAWTSPSMASLMPTEEEASASMMGSTVTSTMGSALRSSAIPEAPDAPSPPVEDTSPYALAFTPSATTSSAF